MNESDTFDHDKPLIDPTPGNYRLGIDAKRIDLGLIAKRVAKSAKRLEAEGDIKPERVSSNCGDVCRVVLLGVDSDDPLS